MTSPVDDEPVAVERVVAREYRVGVSDGAALRGGGMLATTRSVRSSWSAVSTSRRSTRRVLSVIGRLWDNGFNHTQWVRNHTFLNFRFIELSFGVGAHA